MKISFNDWLTGTKHWNPFTGEGSGERAILASKWESRRGRLTRASVEKRATLEYGADAGVGAAAWDAYQQVCLPSSPQPSTQPEETPTP